MGEVHSWVLYDTQAGPGVMNDLFDGRGVFVIGNDSPHKQRTSDVFGCNSGPFTNWTEFGEECNYPKIGDGVRGEYFVDY